MPTIGEVRRDNSRMLASHEAVFDHSYGLTYGKEPLSLSLSTVTVFSS